MYLGLGRCGFHGTVLRRVLFSRSTQYGKSMLRLRAIVVRCDGRLPGAILRPLRDANRVGQRVRAIALQVMCGNSPIGQGPEGRNVGPVHEPVGSLRGRPRLGPTRVFERGVAEGVLLLAHGVNPTQPNGPVVFSVQVRLPALGRRRHRKRSDDNGRRRFGLTPHRKEGNEDEALNRQYTRHGSTRLGVRA